MTIFDTKLIQKSYPINIISGPEKSAWSFQGGCEIWDLQIYRFEEKNNNIKAAVFPCSLILWLKPCFCYLMRKFAFLWWQIIIHKQQCTRMCRGMACKPGRQESVISKASLHADHPPMCLKLLCKCTVIQYCSASLCKKKWGIISATILFDLLWIQLELSLIFHYVNLLKGEVLKTFCVSTLTL